jgi:hypothetical protein
MEVPGWSLGPTVIQRIPPSSDVVADLDAQDVAVEAREASGSLCRRKLA